MPLTEAEFRKIKDCYTRLNGEDDYDPNLEDDDVQFLMERGVPMLIAEIETRKEQTLDDKPVGE